MEQWLEINANSFQACFYYLEQTDLDCIAPKSCLVYHYLSNIYRDNMYPFVQDTFRALFWCRCTVHGTFCALNHKNKAHSLRFWQNMRGAFSTVQRWGWKMMNLHCFMNPMQNCVLFLTMKSLYIFFNLFLCRQTWTQFPGQQGTVSTPAGSINVFLLHWHTHVFLLLFLFPVWTCSWKKI